MHYCLKKSVEELILSLPKCIQDLPATAKSCLNLIHKIIKKHQRQKYSIECSPFSTVLVFLNTKSTPAWFIFKYTHNAPENHVPTSFVPQFPPQLLCPRWLPPLSLLPDSKRHLRGGCLREHSTAASVRPPAPKHKQTQHSSVTVTQHLSVPLL